MALSKHPIRIAGASGASSDRSNHSLPTFAKNHPSEPIDVIIADYLSEANMVASAARKAEQDATVAAKAKTDAQGIATGDPITADPGVAAYEAFFLEGLEPALEDIARYGIRLLVNAGGSDTEGLYRVVMEMIKEKGLDIEVAWVSGDLVLPTIQSSLKSGKADFKNIYTSESLASWSQSHTPISAQAYLGGLGISTALEAGAQIVLCGRVSDASPVIGAAHWWHKWTRHDLNKLANAFVAGHLIECSNYVCGGNFTGFKDLETPDGSWTSIGYPIAEISSSGSVIITKQRNTGGAVTVETCTAQLLYEIQGPLYHNSDVTAVLDQASFTQLGPDRVALHGIGGLPPPPTTKCFLTSLGGYQAEATYYLTGLDIPEKARMLRAQLRKLLAPFSRHFRTLEFSVLGGPVEDATSQNAATVPFRIFAQAPTAEDLAPRKFIRPILNNIMQGYPGATFHLDFRLGFPKVYFDAFVTHIPQNDIQHVMHLPQKGVKVEIPPPPRTEVHDAVVDADSDYIYKEDDHANMNKNRNRWGPTARASLGRIVHARSGDKGPDCNVGFFLPSSARDEHDKQVEFFTWLTEFLTVPTLTHLLGDEARRLPNPSSHPQGTRRKIQRHIFPGLRAVHFLLPNLLGTGEGRDGVTSTSSVDFLGKNVAEFLRGRGVDVPIRLEGYERGGGKSRL